MSYKTLYGAHEARMWLTTVIVPLVIGAIVFDQQHPEVRQNLQKKATEFKNKISNTIK